MSRPNDVATEDDLLQLFFLIYVLKLVDRDKKKRKKFSILSSSHQFRCILTHSVFSPFCHIEHTFNSFYSRMSQNTFYL